MSESVSAGSVDRRLGVTSIFVLLAVGGAIGYGLFPSGMTAGVLFLFAMLAAMLSIVAVHLY